MSAFPLKKLSESALDVLYKLANIPAKEEELDSLSATIATVATEALANATSERKVVLITGSDLSVCIRNSKIFILKPSPLSGSYKMMMHGILIDPPAKEPLKKVAFLCASHNNTIEIKMNETEKRMLEKFKDSDMVPTLIDFFDLNGPIPSSYLLSPTPQESKVFVEELCEGGNLLDLGERDQSFTTDRAALIAYQMFSIVKKFHNERLAIRDIKPENFVRVNKESDKIKMCDLAMICDQCQKEILHGTSLYFSPELFYFPCDLIPSDIWACGFTIAELSHNKDILKAVHPDYPNHEHVLFLQKLVSKPPTKETDPPIAKLSAECLDPNPQTRPTASDLLQSPLMSQSLFHNPDVLRHLEKGWIKLDTFYADLSGIDFKEMEQEYVKEAKAVLGQALTSLCLEPIETV